MKYSILLLLVTLSIFILGFQSREQNLATLLSTSTEANDDLDAIYDLDVFKFYKLEDYNTELKKETYKKTVDYQNHLSELKSKRVEMLKSTYYVVDHPVIPDYDMKRKGFEIELYATWGVGTGGAGHQDACNQSYNGILFKPLPMFSEKVFMQVDEKTGLEIENERGSYVKVENESGSNMKIKRDDETEDGQGIGIYYFFTPAGKEKILFGSRGWICPDVSLKSAYYIQANKVRVILGNKKTGRIYFDKTYLYQPPPQKK